MKRLIQSVHSSGAVYPTSLVECLHMEGRKKAVVRRESELGERPNLPRDTSLEDQMLEQSGYGSHGGCEGR